jgi:predicted RNA binding protein YcfA (HicA-like mRNA interferase family)
MIKHMGKTYNSRDVLRVLQADGWKIIAIRGSHHQLKHPVKNGRVTLPHPKKELPIGTMKSIAAQAKILLSDF